MSNNALRVLGHMPGRRCGSKHIMRAMKPWQSKVWWAQALTVVSMAYLVASQALLDIPGWSASAFACAALVGTTLLAGALCNVWRLQIGKWVLIPCLFVAYCLVRAFSGIRDTAPFNAFTQLASAFLGGMALAVALRVGVRFKALAYAQVAANLLQIVTVFLGLGTQPAQAEEAFRYSGMTGNANLLALQLTLGACLVWMLPRKAGIFPCLFAFGAVAFAIAVTGSRKALLVGAFFVLLVLVQTITMLPKRRRWLSATVVVTLACAIGGLGIRWAVQHSFEIVAVERAVDYDDSSYRTRAEMLEQGLRLWKAAPVFGNGLDAFRGLSGQGTYSHNNYVELLCDLGVTGVLLFYAIHAQILCRAFQAPWSVRVYCWFFVLALLLADLGYVSYASKQAIMILMLLAVVPKSRYATSVSREATKKHTVGNHRLKSSRSDSRRHDIRVFPMEGQGTE